MILSLLLPDLVSLPSPSLCLSPISSQLLSPSATSSPPPPLTIVMSFPSSSVSSLSVSSLLLTKSIFHALSACTLFCRNPLIHNDTIYKLTHDGRRFFKNCAFVHAKADGIIKARRKALQDDVSTKKSLSIFFENLGCIDGLLFVLM